MRPGFFLKLAAWTTSLAILMTIILPAGNLAAYTETSRTSYQEPIAEGVTAQWQYIQTTEGPLNAYVLTVDLANPYVRIDSMAGKSGVITDIQNVTDMAYENGAVAAINGGFFSMKEDAPLGLLVKSGELLSSPIQRTDMYGFGLTKSNVPVFPIFSFEGSVASPAGAQFPLFGINKPTYLAYLADKNPASDANRLNMYTPRWGALSRGSLPDLKGVTEMVVDNNVVREFRVDQPGTLIPANGYVLAGQGTAAQFLTANFRVGDQVRVSYRVTPETDNLSMAVGSMALLVDQGKRHWFTQTTPGKTASSAVGASRDGRFLYLAAVDGGKASRGVTQEEMADFMVSLGAWTAVNLDGGGSTTVSARRLGDQQVSLINRPVNSIQRPVPDALGIFSTAPAGALAGLIIKGPQQILTGTKKSFILKAYDEHYNPVMIDPAEITWNVDSAMGSFQGGTFTAKGPGRAAVKASYKGLSKEYPVTILGGADIAKVNISPARIAVKPGDKVDISVNVTTRDGATINLQPGEYQLQAADGLGTVNGNTFTASNDTAVGDITVKVDTASAAVRVSVGGVEKLFYDFDTAKILKFSALPPEAVTGRFVYSQVYEPIFRGAGAARLDYDFSALSDLRIAYGKFDPALDLPGNPLGLGLWVKGDGGNGHWLRARIVDAGGKEKLLDFAQSVDWTGWKHVLADIPSGVRYPVKLTDIYLVARAGDKQDKGTLYFDELSLLSPATPENVGSSKHEAANERMEVAGGSAGTLQLGPHFTVTLKNPLKTGDYSVSARQLWEYQLPTPGYRPVMPLYELSGEKDGDAVQEFPAAMKIKIEANGVQDINRVRLLHRNEQDKAWRQIPQVTDPGTGIITAKTDKFGLLALMTDSRPAPVFTDTAQSWAREIISGMAARQIVNGYPDGKFLPEKGITRAEFVTLLVNTLGWNAKSADLHFKDAIPQWARTGVEAAVAKGVVRGYNDGTFRPGQVINRMEMAAIVDKALGLPNSNEPSRYADAGQIPAWAVQPVRNTKVSGIITGSGSRFRPKDSANRAEAAAVMARIIEYYVSSD